MKIFNSLSRDDFFVLLSGLPMGRDAQEALSIRAEIVHKHALIALACLIQKFQDRRGLIDSSLTDEEMFVIDAALRVAQNAMMELTLDYNVAIDAIPAKEKMS